MLIYRKIVIINEYRSQSYQTFFFIKQRFFPFFAIKLGYFKKTDNIFLFIKPSSLTTKIGKGRKQSLVGLTPGVNSSTAQCSMVDKKMSKFK
jgi:hypothetical protein